MMTETATPSEAPSVEFPRRLDGVDVENLPPKAGSPASVPLEPVSFTLDLPSGFRRDTRVVMNRSEIGM
jgi:hypothetical protein